MKGGRREEEGRENSQGKKEEQRYKGAYLSLSSLERQE
jgi:hypothetical protein